MEKTGIVEGENPDAVKVFESEAACAPTAHIPFGLAEALGKAEVFLERINRLLSVTTLLLIETLT